MLRFLRHRISDRTILRLIAKWLRAGILENGVVVRSEEGTPQGGPLSPMLSNIYLHYVLDLWFERKIRPSLAGASALVRYAADFVVCFEHRVEAERFLDDLRDRFAKFSLELSEEKTKMVEFGKTSNQNGRCGPSDHPRTFDFLGFTHYMRMKGRRGFRVARKPSRKSRNKFLSNTKAWLKRNRDKSVWYHARQLRRKLIGYYNYFGLRYCKPSLRHIKWHVQRLWVTALRKRSQRHRLHWSRMNRYPWFWKLPEPKLR
jgi:RNA-directed DNA polymerase